MRTKIIATIGPASNSPEIIEKLVDAGVRIFRLNFSHGDVEFFKDLVENIRIIEKKINTPITIMQDLSGPKIRIGILPEGTLNVAENDKLILAPQACTSDDVPCLPFDNLPILENLEIGDRLVLADGGLQFTVDAKIAHQRFRLIALGAGIVTSKKGLALPGKAVPLPAVTEKDKNDLKIGIELGVDAIALSFVQRAEDIRQMRSILKSYGKKLPIVAKLERHNAVENLDEILKETDIVMVARGDLGVECPLPQLPAIQKRIIASCNKAGKPVIVATQMLLSMVNNPAPTRAETTDVANAVLDGADCVMLSEETAMGNHPVETVNYMKQIAEAAESLLFERRKIREPESGTTAEFLAYSACLLAEKSGAKHLVAHSLSGAAARHLSACRPEQRIYALTPDTQSLHDLNFSWGILPHTTTNDPDVPHLTRAQYFVATNPEFAVGEDVVITAGEPNPAQTHRGTNLVKIFTK